MEPWRYLAFNTGEIVGDYLYVSEKMFNGFFKVDLKCGNVVYLGKDNRRDAGAINSHLVSVTYKEKVFFFDCWGNGYTVIDTKNDVLLFRDIEYRDDRKEFTVADVVWRDDSHILLIPWRIAQPLVEIDLENEEVCALDWWNKELSKFTDIITTLYCNSVMVKGELWTLIQRSPYLIKCNLNEQSFECIEFENRKLNTLGIVGTKALITCEDARGICILYDLEKGSHVDVFLELKDNVSAFPYMGVVATKKGFYLLAHDAKYDMVFVDFEGNFDFLNITVNDFVYVDRRHEQCSENWKFRGYKVIQEKMYLYPHDGNGMIVFDMLTNQMSMEVFQLPLCIGCEEVNREWIYKTYYQDEIAVAGAKKEVLNEKKEYFSLQEYIYACSKQKKYSEEVIEKSIGDVIWENIK